MSVKVLNRLPIGVNTRMLPALKGQRIAGSLPKGLILWVVGGAAGGATIGTGPALWPVSALSGGMTGVGLYLAVKRVRSGQQRFARLKEVAILYESVDLFARAGFTVRQSLQMSIILTQQLRPVIEKAMDRWPSGPLRAIQQMGEDIAMPEADVLTGILMHAEEGGAQKISGIMEEEAGRLEKLRQCMAETRMAAKPLYATMYVFLPLIAALGILIAPVAYRAISMISGIKAMN